MGRICSAYMCHFGRWGPGLADDGNLDVQGDGRTATGHAPRGPKPTHRAAESGIVRRAGASGTPRSVRSRTSPFGRGGSGRRFQTARQRIGHPSISPMRTPEVLQCDCRTDHVAAGLTAPTDAPSAQSSIPRPPRSAWWASATSGLPVAVEFGKQRPTIGYDLSTKKVAATSSAIRRRDRRGLRARSCKARRHARRSPTIRSRSGRPTSSSSRCRRPVNEARQPDFSPLESRLRDRRQEHEDGRHRGLRVARCIRARPRRSACRSSSAYSGMRWKQDFHVGYSPERINPGDKEHTFTKILKVVSGDDAETLEKVAELYALGGEGGRLQGLLDQGGRGRQGDREHPARPQHRVRERAVDHLRPPGHRHARGAAGRGHQVELPQVPAGTGRRPLHRRRSRTTSRTRRSSPATTPR